jgi:hypothetical protein
MPYAKHTSTPPPFDATAAAKAPTSNAWEKFPEWKRWVEATGSQDGRGLKDVIEANAIGMDKLKVDIDAHKTGDDARHKTIDNRLAAIEAQLTTAPFPA